MKIVKPASAGTLESSDIQIRVEPAEQMSSVSPMQNCRTISNPHFETVFTSETYFDSNTTTDFSFILHNTLSLNYDLQLSLNETA